MRINPNMGPAVLAALSRTRLSQQKALEELSTGRRVNVPSDDPAASAALVDTHVRSNAVDQYSQNVDSLKNMMSLADTALGNIVSQVNQAISLGAQGGDGTLSDANRQSLAEQVNGIIRQIASQANVAYKGVFLFAGTKNDKPPFVADASSTSGYTYQGNSGVNVMEIGESLNTTTNVPGDQIFMAAGADLFQSLHDLSTSLQSGTQAQITDATADVRTAMDHLTQKRVFYGNGINQLNAQNTYLQQATLNIQAREQSLVGVDISQAVIDLTQAQTANSAALAAAAKILPQSLLDYLK